MKRALKIIGLALALLLLSAAVLPFLFKDKLLSKAKESINQNLHAQVDFGEFDLSFLRTFPYIGLSLNQLSVVGKDDFKGDTLLYSKRITVNLNLMSVLRGGPYHIKRIRLEGARIRALVNAAGKANWDITKTKEEAAKADKKNAFQLKLSEFSLTNSYLFYQDKQMGFQTEMLGLNHTLAGDFSQDDLTMKTLTEADSWSLSYGGIGYLRKAKTRLEATLQANLPGFRFRFNDNTLRINDLEVSMEGMFARPKTDAMVDLTFRFKKADIKSILSLVPGCYTQSFEGVKASGNVAANAFVKGVYSAKTIPAFGFMLSIENGRFQYPALPLAVTDLQVNLRVHNPTGVPDQTVVDLSRFHANLGGNILDARMNLTTPVSDPAVVLEAKGKIDLGNLHRYVPLESGQKLTGIFLADLGLNLRQSWVTAKAYNRIGAKGVLSISGVRYQSATLSKPVSIEKATLAFSPEHINLSEMAMTIGKSDLNLKGTLDNLPGYMWGNQKLQGTLNLQSGTLDANELLGITPPASDTAAAATAPPQVPTNVELDLKGKIGHLLYSNLDMRLVEGRVLVTPGKIDLQNLSAQTLGGTLKVVGIYHTLEPAKPFASMSLDFGKASIPALFRTFGTLQKLTPILKQADGSASVNMAFSCRLLPTMQPNLNTLSGSGSVKTHDVVLNNFPMLNQVADALQTPQYKRLSLQNINLSFAFSDGKILVSPFTFPVGGVPVTLEGTQFFDQRIDYRLRTSVPMDRLGNAGNSLVQGLAAKVNAMGGNVRMGDKVNLAANIKGTVSNPKLDLGVAEAAKGLKDQAEKQAREALEREKAALEAKAKAEVEQQKALLEAKAKQETERLKTEAEKARKAAETKAKAEAEKAKKAAEDKLKKEAENRLKGLFGK
jgi:hypothetical protein